MNPAGRLFLASASGQGQSAAWRPPIRIGVPRETAPGERRVAATPETVKKLAALGVAVMIERDAGASAGYPNEAYVQAGATLGSKGEAIGQCEAVLKVRPPALDEVAQLKEGCVLICLLQPERNPSLLEALKARRVSAIALEKIPRITRAQIRPGKAGRAFRGRLG